MTESESDRDDRQESTAPTATAEPEPPSPTTQFAGPLAAPPEPGPTGLSPDGATLAYFLHETDGRRRFLLHPLDGEPRELPIQLHFAPVEDRDGPQWSPDGAQLAFTGRHDGRSAIFLVDVESGAARLLVDHPSADHTPRWSPDGQTIAFVSRCGERDAICVVPAGGSGRATQLTDAFPGQDEREPVWSKSGDRVAFIRRTIEGAEPQIADHIWSVAVATGAAKQLTKKAAIRHSLRWGPERPLIVHVTEDGEWDQLAVVNADNSAGWTLASEAGDKADPRWSADGSRVLYTRSQGGITRCCDRATSAASAILLDPGDGVAAYPRWLPGAEKRVVYAFAAPGQPFRFVVQANTADAERGEIAIVDWQPERSLVTPVSLEVESAAGNKLGGFLYRQAEVSGPTPAVVLLPDRPHATPDARFRGVEQALAAAGLAVATPVLAGMRGRGRTLTKALAEQAGRGEEEVSDLVDVIAKVRQNGGIDATRVAVAGSGFGATLALLLAGARPGLVQAVVAIDPVVDWGTEFDAADDPWRAWLTRTYGLPVANPGTYALRTPATFVGVIDAPLLLLGTATAPPHRTAQLDRLLHTLDSLGVPYTRDVIAVGSDWETGARIATFLRETFLALPPAVPTSPPPANEPRPDEEPAPPEEPSAAAAAPSENGLAADAARTDAV